MLLNGNEAFSIEFRFATTTNATARNNLADAPIRLRDNAAAVRTGNLLTAAPGMFVNPATGDLHLVMSTTNAIDQAPALGSVTNDFDGHIRPGGARPDIGADEFTTNAPPVITAFSCDGINAAVSFDSILGLSYDVERADDLGGSDWSSVVTNVAGTGSVIEIFDSSGAGRSRQFYRVKLAL
jgi:hypothetical protein